MKVASAALAAALLGLAACATHETVTGTDTVVNGKIVAADISQDN
jgi:hypothetical protein